MFQEKISFEQALLLEKENKIVIYNPNVVESIYSNVKEWQDNWNTLRKTFRKVSCSKIIIIR
jgi:FMN-dependent NADH-azoreductase